MKRQACKWWCKYLESSTTSIWSKKKLKKYIFGSSWSNVKKLSTSKLKVHQALDHPVLELTKKHSIFCKKTSHNLLWLRNRDLGFLEFSTSPRSIAISTISYFRHSKILKFWVKKILEIKEILGVQKIL